MEHWGFNNSWLVEHWGCFFWKDKVNFLMLCSTKKFWRTICCIFIICMGPIYSCKMMQHVVMQISWEGTSLRTIFNFWIDLETPLENCWSSMKSKLNNCDTLSIRKLKKAMQLPLVQVLSPEFFKKHTFNPKQDQITY